MNERSTDHATFAIERIYPTSPERVFRAWADPARKQRWFACHEGWTSQGYALDFRVGGREHVTSIPEDGVPHVYDAIYYDIVLNYRIIYGYTMHLGEKKISVSLATVVIEPSGKGTRLTFTEQSAFLDGFDGAVDREHGTRALLDSLGEGLLRELMEENPQ